MRKIKLQLQYRVPSWGFCIHDVHTDNNRMSKELCRFCVKDRLGYTCVLHDEPLRSDKDFIYKTAACIDATAGFAITVDEPTPTQGPAIDPNQLMAETIKLYDKTVKELINNKFPRPMAEAAAKKYILEGKI